MTETGNTAAADVVAAASADDLVSPAPTVIAKQKRPLPLRERPGGVKESGDDRDWE